MTLNRFVQVIVIDPDVGPATASHSEAATEIIVIIGLIYWFST